MLFYWEAVFRTIPRIIKLRRAPSESTEGGGEILKPCRKLQMQGIIAHAPLCIEALGDIPTPPLPDTKYSLNKHNLYSLHHFDNYFFRLCAPALQRVMVTRYISTIIGFL